MSNRITYADKVAINQNASIPDINKVNYSDMNEIKGVINGIVDQVIDMFEDTLGSSWQEMMKNKMDYCVSHMNTTKTNTSAFINGGWRNNLFGLGMCSKIGVVYQLLWFSNRGTYYCEYNSNSHTYQYKVLNGDNYSTNEQVMGIWTDGKVIYRKTITTTGNSNTSQVIGNIPGIDSLISLNVWETKSNIWRNGTSIFYGNIQWASQVYFSSVNGNFTQECGTSFADFKNGATIYLTAEYTKTSD